MKLSKPMVVLVLVVFSRCGLAQFELDPKLPDYQGVPVEDGSVIVAASDEMNSLMLQWAEGFRVKHSHVKVELQDRVSDLAFAAMMDGEADFAAMVREPTALEIATFNIRFGYPPTVAIVSTDVLAVFVHKDNPIKGLSFDELDTIFSLSRRRGAERRSEEWKEFKGTQVDERIQCFALQSASAASRFIRSEVFWDGEFGSWVQSQSGSLGVVRAVGQHAGGVGICSVAFQTRKIRPIAVSVENGGALVMPTRRAVAEGKYPLARRFCLVCNSGPNRQLNPLQVEILRYVLSKQGQEVVAQRGYFPLSGKAARKTRDKIGI